MLELVADSLAVWRLVRLLMRDEITKEARASLTGWTLKNGHTKLRYLIQCPHCIGIYAAVFVIALRYVRGGSIIRDGFAVAGLNSILWELEPKATQTD